MKLVIDIDEDLLTLIRVDGHLTCDNIEKIRNALIYSSPLAEVLEDKLSNIKAEISADVL